MTLITGPSATSQLEVYRLTYGQDPYRLEALLVRCGSDVSVIVGGGHRYHTGAIALASCHPSPRHPTKHSATASVLALRGHKEDEIVRTAALTLASALETTVTFAAGIHLDDASPADIAHHVDNFERSMELVLEQLWPRSN